MSLVEQLKTIQNLDGQLTEIQRRAIIDVFLKMAPTLTMDEMNTVCNAIIPRYDKLLYPASKRQKISTKLDLA